MSCCNNSSSNQEGMLIVNKAREAAACAEANCASSFTNATNAATSATNAANSAAAAAASETNVENLWEDFQERYMGPYATPPVAISEGSLYYNTVSNGLFVWNGSAWASADFNEFTNFTATGTTTARNLVTRFADVINVKDFGAVGDGVADDTAAFNNAQSAVGFGGTLVIPKGNYLVSGTVYPVEGLYQWINKGYTGGINLASQARAAAQLITVETADTSPEEFALSRRGLSVTAVAKGAQHSDGIYSGIVNSSTDGDGNTAIYANATTDTDSFWTAGVHSETRHGGGLTMAYSVEAESYSTAGYCFGAVINNSTTPGSTNPITGQPAVAHPLMTGIFFQGQNNINPMCGWVYGLDFGVNSMRPNGVAINIQANALVNSFFKTSSSSASSVADIWLSGNSINGIILDGSYSSSAIRIKQDQSIAFETTGQIKQFYSSAIGALYINSGSTNRARIFTTAFVAEFGQVRPLADNTYLLGGPANRWSEVYAATGAINTSDEREKTFLSIEGAEKLAALEIKQNLRKFKFNSAIEKKGENARIHFGASAQQVGDIMKSHGLNPDKYGFYCYDEWDEVQEQKDNDGNIIQEYRAAGNRYGLRYEELLAFIISAI